MDGKPLPPSGGLAPDGLAPDGLDWVDEAEWQRICAVLGEGEEPPDPMRDMYDDPDSGAPPDWEQEPLAVLDARAEAEGAEHAARMTRLVAAGLAGWAHDEGGAPVPGPVTGLAAGFGQGRPLDDAVPCTPLSTLADEASGQDRAFAGVNDDQLMGLIGTRARLIARQHWELAAAAAEFIRRRPEPGCDKGLPGNMPAVWGEHAASELAAELNLPPAEAAELLGVALELTAKLPRTNAALRDGLLDWDKARITAAFCFNLTPGQAAQAEAILFGDDAIRRMTRGKFRKRVGRAVMEVDPGAARRRRKEAAKDKRVEVTQELSGNSRLNGRELPPEAVAVATQNLDDRALELRRAGVPGGMDELRALALMEKLGAMNPLAGLPGSGTDGGNSGGGPGPGSPSPGGAGAAPGKPLGGVATHVNLTIPLLSYIGLEDRPGMLSRIGPIDAALARDMAAAAARDPRTTWCITVTGPDHRPVAHGCGQPPPRRGKRRRKDTPADDHGPPGTGTIRLTIPATTGTTSTSTSSDLVFTLESLAGPCDHRHQAAGHDPGRKLRHLTGILNQTCTFSVCNCPEQNCDYEHSTPYDKGGKTCLCQAGPVCRRNHRDKQSPGWHLEEAGNRGWFRWTTPSGRSYLSKPTQYPD
jgi:hypothetical protein